MLSHSPTGAGARTGSRRSRIAAAIPLCVGAATLGLLVWSAWPVLRPAREVAVVQAVFTRASVPSAQDSAQSKARDVPTVQAAGWLEAEPFTVACTALADGVVESIHVLEGDPVERGELVAKLVDDDSRLRLQRAEAELAGATARLSNAEAEYRAAERSWDDPVELERAVATGRAARDEGVAELAQLPALVRSAEATLLRLMEVAARTRASVERGAANEIEQIIAEQHVIAQRAETDALRAREPVLSARVERLRAELRAAERDLELRIADRLRVDTAAAAVADAEAGVARARAVRDEAALELDRMEIRAPISGYVQRRMKAPGDKVIRSMDDPASAQLVRLYDPSRLQVRVDIPLADAAHVSVGQVCEVIVEVLPDRTFTGEVLRITHEADLQKNTLQAKVKVIDPDPILRPEMLTRVRFLSGGRGGQHGAGASADPHERETARVRVPSGAIDARGAEECVWLVTERRHGQGVLVPRAVEVIEDTNGWATVDGDLQPGSIVALGVEHPRAGERVVVKSAGDEGGVL